MFRWLFGRRKKKNPEFDQEIEQAQKEIRSQVAKWMKQGATRQAVCDKLLALPVKGAKLRASLDVEKELFSVMVERNLTGKQLEKKGKDERAVVLYEDNLKDGFCGTHPYTRLRIIYSRRKDYPNAIRVCRAYLDLPATGRKMAKPQFRKHLHKLEKMGK